MLSALIPDSPCRKKTQTSAENGTIEQGKEITWNVEVVSLVRTQEIIYKIYICLGKVIPKGI